ncbi:MAG: tetratricopeptide repeat protein [Bacteroidetes bacterium]|nr:tetratricopeptide repeat protein [Bacteroidota bacterium]
MANILQFPVQPRKFGFKAVRKKSGKAESKSQLNIFEQASGNVMQMPVHQNDFDQALTLDERGDLKAADYYQKVIDDGGDNAADAYCNLGILESKRNRSARAFDCFTQSLKVNPRHFEAHFNLGNLYFDQGDFRLAKLHYELAAEIDPEFPNTYFNLGLALAINNEFEPAVKALRRYTDLTPPQEAEKADDLIRRLTEINSSQI